MHRSRSVSFLPWLFVGFLSVGCFLGCGGSPEKSSGEKKVDPEFAKKLIAARKAENKILAGVNDVPTMNQAWAEILAKYKANREVWETFRTMSPAEKQALQDSGLGPQWIAAKKEYEKHLDDLIQAFPNEGSAFASKLQRLEGVGLLTPNSSGEK